MGRHADSFEYCRRALALDPLSPVINVSNAYIAHAAGRPVAEALALAQRAESLGMGSRGRVARMMILLSSGDPHSARALAQDGTVEAAVLEAIIDPARKPAAMALLESAPPGSRRVGVALQSQTWSYILLGEIDRAFAAARRSIEDRSMFAYDVLVHDASPNVARFHADPRFRQLVRDAGLLEYWHAVAWPDLCRPAADTVVCGPRTDL
jgi:hypothetical protein